ncbi:MAG TPA: SDR family oxidoreductase [Flavobacteriales bacterium]|nr:SDR family oxidoreductase [Flavobacteriales bacterium]
MNLDLTGKTALVCGSTQGIGKASALELAALGATVYLCARDEAKLKSVLGELDKSKGQQHDYLVADFSDTSQVHDRINAFVAKKGVINIVVNNTGGPAGGPITEAKPEDFLHAFNNHLINNHSIVRATLNGMKTAGYGRIINIISTSVKMPLPNLGVSNTIRAAVANWSKTLANEVGKFNITVNNVLPGATNTGRLQQIAATKSDKTGTKIEDVFNHMASEVPMGRIGEPHEVAAAVAFLASPAASYINGINLPVDGGRTGNL